MKVEEGWTLWMCVWLFNTVKELVPYFCLPPPTTDAWLIAPQMSCGMLDYILVAMSTVVRALLPYTLRFCLVQQ